MNTLITLLLINIAFVMALWLRKGRDDRETSDYIIAAFYVRYIQSGGTIHSPHYVALNFV
jgi:hypothetical protein